MDNFWITFWGFVDFVHIFLSNFLEKKKRFLSKNYYFKILGIVRHFSCIFLGWGILHGYPLKGFCSGREAVQSLPQRSDNIFPENGIRLLDFGRTSPNEARASFRKMASTCLVLGRPASAE